MWLGVWELVSVGAQAASRMGRARARLVPESRAVFINPAAARIGSRARVGDSFERLKRSEFRDALDGVRRARFRQPELPQQMPTDFLNDWISDRDLDLPVDGHFENALWSVAEHEAGEVDVRV